MSIMINGGPTRKSLEAEAERQIRAAVKANDGGAQAMLLHAAYTRRVVAAHLLRTGQPSTAEAIAATVDVDLALVRTVLDALVQDHEIVQQGVLFSWPRAAA